MEFKFQSLANQHLENIDIETDNTGDSGHFLEITSVWDLCLQAGAHGLSDAVLPLMSVQRGSLIA